MTDSPLWDALREGCGTCEFAGPCNEHRQVECRRFPPTLVPTIARDQWSQTITQVEQYRPWMLERGWCGEYKRKGA